MATQLATSPPMHSMDHSRPHSAAEGLAILGIGAIGMGAGVWLLLNNKGGSSFSCPSTNPAVSLGLQPGDIVTAPPGPPSYHPVGAYILDSNLVKHAVPALSIAAACGYNLSSQCVVELTSEQLYCIPTGYAITTGNCLPPRAGCSNTGGGPGEPPTMHGYGAGGSGRRRR